jgi:hypothetical protein
LWPTATRATRLVRPTPVRAWQGHLRDTEHFTLRGARSSTIAETTGRATMFLGAVSGGLVTLGLIATAPNVGAAFYAFG